MTGRGWIARMRFKRQTMVLVRHIFATYGSVPTARFLQTTFGHNLGRMLSNWAASDLKPEEAASIIAIKTLGVVLRTLSEDSKQLALFALRNDNRGEHVWNHLRAVISTVYDITSNENFRDAAIYQIMGALQGLSGEDLENYRGERQVADVIKRMAEDAGSPHDIFPSR
jgi:hypothetical protein